MSRFVPYLAEKVIERNAAALLAEYEHERGLTITPPIPEPGLNPLWLCFKHLYLYKVPAGDIHSLKTPLNNVASSRLTAGIPKPQPLFFSASTGGAGPTPLTPRDLGNAGGCLSRMREDDAWCKRQTKSLSLAEKIGRKTF